MNNGIMVVIAAVFVITIVFGILILRQFSKFEKKALHAKQQKDEYIRQLEEEKAKIADELKNQLTADDLPPEEEAEDREE